MPTSPWPRLRLSTVPNGLRAESLAEEIAGLKGVPTGRGPTDLGFICQAGGFVPRLVSFARVRPARPARAGRAPRRESFLVPRPGGFTILVDADLPGVTLQRASPSAGNPRVVQEAVVRRRYRFRIAHEVAHSFFYDRGLDPPRRPTTADAAEEEFCDRFAAALLLPSDSTRSFDGDPGRVFSLSKAFDVSVEVVGRSLAARSEAWCVLGLVYAVNPRTRQDPDWRVAWSAGQFVPRVARLRSEVVRASASSGRAGGVEDLRLGGLRGTYHVEAARSPSGAQVVAVLVPSGQAPAAVGDRSAPDQFRLF